MKILDDSIHQRFSTRLGFLMSVLGIAVGTGNIWRFPRIVAQNGSSEGSGAFLIAWLIFLFLWSIPLVLAEYALGRKCRMGVIGSIAKMAGIHLAWMGSFIAFVSVAISFFYSVVVGWCLYYFIQVITSSLPLDLQSAQVTWNSYQAGCWPLVTHASIMAVGAWAIWAGVRSIEKINRILIPALLGILLLSLVRSLILPGAGEGLSYLFHIDWMQLLKPKIWLEALTQNAWDVGAGWGLFLTYAAYLKREHSLVKNGFLTPIGNNIISLVSAMIIFSTVFSVLSTEMAMSRDEILQIMRTSGPASTGLTFIWMPQLFAKMMLGRPLAVLFFLGLMFAGFSSLIAMLELAVRVFIDAGIKRPKAIVIIIGLSYLLGIPSAVSLEILRNQDFVWGYALILSGALVAITVIRYGTGRLRKEELACDPHDLKLGGWWDKIITGFVPPAALILIVWWFVQEATPGVWYNPLNAGSISNCLLQWLVVLLVLWLASPALAKRTFDL